MKPRIRPIEKVHFLVATLYPNGKIVTETCVYNPRSWKKRSESLVIERDRIIGEKRCIITGNPIAPNNATSEEHIILQGLGTKWLVLPRGLVDDNINNSMSHHDRLFLNSDDIAIPRIFHHGARKRHEFTLNDGTPSKIESDPNKGISLFVHNIHNLKLEETTPGGPGHITITTLSNNIPRYSISKSIHKMAYLALIFEKPEFMKSSILNASRNLISSNDTDFELQYRTVETSNISTRGFHFAFAIDRRIPGVTSLVQAAVKIHATTYRLSLSGHTPLDQEIGVPIQDD